MNIFNIESLDTIGYGRDMGRDKAAPCLYKQSIKNHTQIKKTALGSLISSPSTAHCAVERNCCIELLQMVIDTA